MLFLPISLIGVFVGLLIAGSTFNVFSAIGVITLMGLVVVPVVLVYIDRVGLWTKKRFGRSADELARRHKPAE
jgi:multidrug efflux pump subunit AcrB